MFLTFEDAAELVESARAGNRTIRLDGLLVRDIGRIVKDLALCEIPFTTSDNAIVLLEG